MECIFQNYWGYSAAGCHSFSIHLAYQCPWVLYMIPTVIFLTPASAKPKKLDLENILQPNRRQMQIGSF